ncbi:MAG TPA: gephyrin-like molybdotransferase Glp [Verrucomicrobiae bacterium]|nr:gephyrin-like molybdotransferase Glp [Verrucomicrobiae bacterium]
MITVEEARARILAAFAPLAAEQVALTDGLGRVLAEDIVARVTQPPSAVSAMDGYAVRAADVMKVPVQLRVTGYAQAGHALAGKLQAGEAARIFTGAALPPGADAVVIQEDTTASGDHVEVREAVVAGRHVRTAGTDFNKGDVLLKKGRRLTARDIGIAAAMNAPWLRVTRRPRIAVLATGDEVVMPGEPIGPTQIVSSNSLSLSAFVTACGAEAIHLGIAPDDLGVLQQMAAAAAGADLLVTSGGASVGEHDLVQKALGAAGMELDFWKIAMRPGKPLLFGRLGATPVLGLPGNPVSAMVGSTLFLRPAIDRMLGLTASAAPGATAILGRDLPENDNREDYLRAEASYDSAGRLVATPFPKQDSSMLSLMARADCLVVRPIRAPAIKAGATVPIVFLAGGALSI